MLLVSILYVRYYRTYKQNEIELMFRQLWNIHINDKPEWTRWSHSCDYRLYRYMGNFDVHVSGNKNVRTVIVVNTALYGVYNTASSAVVDIGRIRAN